MKKAAIITIGSELLEGLILNKNAQFLCQELKNLGYRVVKVSTVGDDLISISEEVKTLLLKVDLSSSQEDSAPHRTISPGMQSQKC